MDDITIVTAFYNLKKNKYNNEFIYYHWSYNYLSNCNSKMVIFTNKETYDYIKKIRENYIDKTHIIILEINDFYTYKYIDYWNKDYNRDHEQNYHNINLYMIWNEKCKFVEKAININPFNTLYFIWSDIGIIRDEKYIKYIKTFPNKNIIEKIDKNKMHLLYIEPYNNIPISNDIILNGASNMFLKQNYIGGTIFFGHKDIFKIYIDKYYLMLEEFIKNDFFAGKDQSIMACVYFNNKELFNLIKPDLNLFNDPWFYLLYFFH